MANLSKDELELRAKQLWQQRENAVAEMMRNKYGEKDFKTMDWSDATKRGRDLMRKHARSYHKRGLPNNWLIEP